MPTPATWRRWHRWIAAPSALFLLFAALTGTLVAATEFFGEAEATREADRRLVSDVRTDTPIASWTAAIATAMAAAAREAPGAPVDRVSIDLKGEAPEIGVYLGKPAGGEDRKLRFDARTGAPLGEAEYVDKAFINRVHSGEAFGDGGLVAAMLWGLALSALTVSGFLLWWRLFRAPRPDRAGWRRVFF